MLTEKKNSKSSQRGEFSRVFVLTGSFFTCQHRGETQFNTITVGVGAVQLADVFIVFHPSPSLRNIDVILPL